MMRHLLLLTTLLLATPQAEASTKSYGFPPGKELPLAACLANTTECGKTVADAFCRREGFAEAVLFARTTVTAARILDTTKTCNGPQCQAFTRIKCFSPQATNG